MRYIILVSLLFIGCGDDVGVSIPTCETFDEDYSHSIVLCGGRSSEDVVDIFVACNVRVPPSERTEGCISGFGLKDWGCDCEIEHICWSEP